MRIIGTIPNESNGKKFSSFLSSQGVKNTYELVPITDWDNPDYGMNECKIWIEDEDDVEKSLALMEAFNKDPASPIYEEKIQVITPQEKMTGIPIPPPIERKYSSRNIADGPSPITFYIIMICTALFIFSQMTEPKLKSIPSYLPPTAVLSSPVNKKLYYDYPKAFEYIDKYVQLYGLESLDDPNSIPEEGQYLLGAYLNSNYWRGFYHEVLKKYGPAKKKNNDLPPPVLFEKIREGEIWRAFTPALLHSDTFHLLFNLLWFFVLGKQMEARLSPKLFIVFLLFTGIFSNTAQYLMSGSNFIGISGILCAMLTFIWFRQKKAPWEGYQLHSTTMGIMTLFIVAVALIQVASFFSEIFYNFSFSPGFANTAHLAGAFIGYIMAQIPVFTRIKI